MKKKLSLILLLVVALVLVPLAPYRAEGTEFEMGLEDWPEPYDMGGRTIRFTAWWDLTPQEGESESTDQLIQRYAELEEAYNVTFEYIQIPWEDYQSSYITNALAGDSIGDVAIVEYNWFYPNLVMNDFLTDVNELGVFDFTEDKWNDTVYDISTFEDKTYGFETGRLFPTSVLFFNKGMFDREGISYPYEDFFNDEWTWDNMLEIAQKLTKDTDGDGVIDQWGLSGTNLINQFVYSNGAETIDISDPYQPKFILDSTEALAGFQAMQDFSQLHNVVELNPEGAEWDYAKSQFINGNIGMFAGPWWMVDDMVNEMEDPHGVLLFPMGPDAENYASASSNSNVSTIPANVQDKEDVALLFDLRTDPLPDDDPDDWRIYFEDRTTDAESVEVIGRLQDENLTKFDTTSCFNGVVELSYTYNYQIEHGDETPQAAIGAIKDQAQNLIDTAMKISPQDILDSLNPDEEDVAEEDVAEDVEEDLEEADAE